MLDAINIAEISRLIVRATVLSVFIPLIAMVRPFPIFLQTQREAKFALGSLFMLNIIWNVFRTNLRVGHEPSMQTYVAWVITLLVMAVGHIGVVYLLWPYATSTDDRSRGERRFLLCAVILAVVLIPYISFGVVM